MRKSCAFIGHHELLLSKNELSNRIRQIMTELVEKHKVNTFYVGNNGNFEIVSSQIAMQFKHDFPQYHLNICYVLSYENDLHNTQIAFSSFLYPIELNKIPFRFKIIKRNEWVISRSQFIIGYIPYSFGGAYRSLQYALQKKCQVFHLIQPPSEPTSCPAL